jgi:hypothetical protein
VTLDACFEQTRADLTRLCGLPEGTGVFLTPSGSDAEYIPLLIVKALNPGKKIANIVTCNEEVGSGTLNAAGGKFFSPVEPIPGYTDCPKKDGDPLIELAEDVETIAIPARSQDGSAVIAAERLDQIVDKCVQDGSVPIIHSVAGSKTGIVEQFPSEFLQKVEQMNGLVVVDACQGRHCNDFTKQCLESNACLLFTGSKFFRGPPFSGAVFVPQILL